MSPAIHKAAAGSQPAVKLYAVHDPLPRAFIAGRAASIQTGIDAARAALDSGRAQAWLGRLRQFAVEGQ